MDNSLERGADVNDHALAVLDRRCLHVSEVSERWVENLRLGGVDREPAHVRAAAHEVVGYDPRSLRLAAIPRLQILAKNPYSEKKILFFSAKF